MKRLHIIGKSKDNRRLYLARAKDAKFGSFEIPISAKLLKLLREAEEAKEAKAPAGRAKRRSPAPKSDAVGEAAVGTARSEGNGAASGNGGAPAPSPPPEPRAGEGAESPPADRREGAPQAPERTARRRPTAAAPARSRRAASDSVTPRGSGADTPSSPNDMDDVGSVRVVRRESPERAARPRTTAAEGVDLPLAPPRKGREEPAPKPPERKAPKRAERKAAGASERPRQAASRSSDREERSPITARTKRPEIPARSKLSPAEIQSLIRAGRTPRTVAQMAGTQLAWVKWLAEPVQQERMAIVGQALGQRQTRARLGASAEPLGSAVAQNLRSRGVSGADRIVEDGFTAVRPDGGTWRLRLSFEHRGRRTSAVWTYDPQRRELTPINTLASQLGWRRPRALPAGDGAGGPDGSAPARTSRRGTSKSRASKTSAARKKTGSRSPTSSRSTSRRRRS